MANHKPITPSVAESHLSVDKLYQYMEGKLPAAASQEVEQHLLNCDLCADALEGLARVSKSEAEHALFDINRHVKKRSNRSPKNTILHDIKNWGLIAAVLFLLIFSAVVVWYQVNQSATDTKPAAAPASTTAPVSVPGKH